MHVAAGYGHEEGVQILLEAGANVNCRTTVKGSTPLHLACANKHWSVVQRLIQAGADKNANDQAGKTPWEKVPTDCHTNSTVPELLAALRPPSVEAKTVGTPSVAPVALEKCRKAVWKTAMSPTVSDPVPLTWEYVQTCIHHFEPTRLLGEGAFGQVYLGRDSHLGLDMAIKLLRLRVASPTDLNEIQRNFRREIRALKSFRHPNIIVLYGYNLQVEATEQFLVFEYAARGSLDNYLRDENGRAQLSGAMRRLSIMYQVARSVHFLHTGGSGCKIMHRDLKSSNICLTKDFTAKLVDCGFAKFVLSQNDGDRKHTSHKMDDTMFLPSGKARFGTEGYICPAYKDGEIDEYLEACDVYSIGVVMVEMVVGCLQGRNAARGETKIGVFSQRYVSKFQVPIVEGWKQLMEDADRTAFEWNAEALERVCRAAIDCMSPDPGKRPASADLITTLNDAVQFQFEADNPVRESQRLTLNDEQRSRWSSWSNFSRGDVACVLCHQTLEGVMCVKGHSICFPCISARIMFRAGHLGDLCCPIVGCHSGPFTDDQLYGRVPLRAFEVFKESREGQQLIDKRLKNMEEALRKLSGSIENMASDLKQISSGVRRCLRALASFSSETFKSCPGLVWLVPADKCASARSPSEWAVQAGKKKYLLYFICQHSFTEVQPPLEIDAPRWWLARIAPVLQIGLFVIKAAAIGYGLPFPYSSSSSAERIQFEEQFINSLVDGSTAELALLAEKQGRGELDDYCGKEFQALVGKGYDFIAQKANEAKNSSWKKVMAPAINVDGTSIWVKAEYRDLYRY